ncbi:ribose 5-phosphate isomerase B [Hwanghaeella sp.]|uniref:ribose 5-phosphate isomerase B n=1 Tax=Hwanghaeella sp. TaxID=2605943 RepID=UPI003CCBBA41
MTDETIAIASDHAGLEMKNSLAEQLRGMGFTVQDLGTNSKESVDYPDYAEKLAAALETGPARRGVLVCGTGIGISIAANRHRHIRAALCRNSTDARLSRQHNDANVIVLGERTMGQEVAADCLRAFLETKFDGGRHGPRVSKMS